MSKAIRIFIKSFLIIQLVLLFVSCDNKETKTVETTTAADTTAAVPDSVMQLKYFSKKELYDELLARAMKTTKSNKSDTVPPKNIKLKKYSNKSIYDVIYETDDRKNIYEVSDPLLLNDAKKAACIVMKDQLVPNADGTFSILSKNNLKTKYGVCDDENFSAEPISAFCSGFAVSNKVFITAGHCIKGKDITKIVIVYGFEVNKAGNVNKTIRAADIFQPVEIIKIEKNALTKNDYCVLKITGVFPPDRIAAVRMNGKINDKEEVHLIGYPCGLPVKITPNGKVLNNTISNYFVTNLDSYEGNSGSPVFNSKTHIVEGILVRGNDDFPTIATGSCKRSLICPVNIGNCEGEDVSRTSQFLPWIK